jgi:small redox-active disulfide protein 2
MEIKVLGTGCPKCQQLHRNVLDALSELNLNAEVTKIEDIMEIMQHGVAATPALLVDGKIVAKGRLMTTNEIKEILTK